MGEKMPQQSSGETMNQELELELTYLAKERPKEIEGATPTRIMDVYIPDSPEHSRLRLRQKGDRYEMTKKMPVREGDASEQIEMTIPLDEEEFLTLAQSSQKRVAKDRYTVDIDGRSAEVDVFVGDLSGLILIDFEFSSPEEKTTFTPPSVVLSDVTQEDFIAGGLLAGRAYDDITNELDRFGYGKIV
jgi:CYTH domain-containing protein